MPTGGGKSLCYQLPALVLGQTVVVVSPLIALMQDQVAQLAEMGIPAALVNSSQAPDEQRAVMRAATQGAFRLLYLSPERLARPDTAAWLRAYPAGLLRHRRSPLHLRMGPRIPPRIPPAQPAAPPFSR